MKNLKEKLMSVSSVFSAIFAMMCWSGGLVLTALGLGTVGSSFFANMTRYKPLFVMISAFLLYRSYSVIEREGASNFTKIVFWLSATLSILILYSPIIFKN